MCGIAGIYHFDQKEVVKQEILSMTTALTHRGPDGEGHYFNDNKNLALGHRRLAILDLSEKGHQPMRRFNRYVISYNGEIYNYLELAQELKSKGHQFESQTDTEVLLAAYAEWGPSCLKRLDGMFAFAIYDEKEQELFCARDRFGEKPFYYYHQPEESFYFFSEIKAIKEIVKLKIDHQMIYSYLQHKTLSLYFDKSRTFYNNIRNLEAGNYLIVSKSGKLKKQAYWNLELKENNLPFEQAKEKFRELFYNSVQLRLRSDVPVGSSLSGGLDSSSIVMAISKSGKFSEQKTFSARFRDEHLDEGRFMDAVNTKANTKSCQVFPEVEDLAEQFEDLFRSQDEPFGSAGIFAQREVMKLAKKEKVTVLLDGQGADEVLAGYPKYYQTYFKWLFKYNRKRFAEEVKAYNNYHSSHLKFNLPFILEAYFPEAIDLLARIKRNAFGSTNYNELHPDFYKEQKDSGHPFKRFNSLKEELRFSVADYGLEKLLRYSDRNSMAFSREVRLPFLSHQLVEFVFSLPPNYFLNQGSSKYLLRESMKKDLPELIYNRKDKIGYEPPQAMWLKHPKMVSMLKKAKEASMQAGFVTKQSTISDWQYLMMYQLILNSEG